MALSPDQFGEPEQLKMFMTPREIMGRYEPGDIGRMPNWPGQEGRVGRFWDQKRQDAPHRFDVAQVATQGPQRPIELDSVNDRITNGHHRLIVSYDAAPDRLVSVMHEGGGRYNYKGMDEAFPEHTRPASGVIDAKIAKLQERRKKIGHE